MPFDITKLTDAAIIYGGLTLGLLYITWAFYKTVTNHGHDWRKSMDRNSEAFVKVAKSLAKLESTLHELIEKK